MIRDIRISAVLNGFEVKVDCQTLVFTDVTEMLKEIRRYLKKSEEVEKEYLEKALNAKHMVPMAPQNPVPTAPLSYTTTDSTSAAFPPSQWVTLPNSPNADPVMSSNSTSYYSLSNQNLSNPSVGTT